MNDQPPIIPLQPPLIQAPAQPRPLPAYGFVCESCGYFGNQKTFTKGSILIELFLWCLILIPGLIYSLWRLTSRFKACPKCQGHMIPATTPRGQAILKQLYQR